MNPKLIYIANARLPTEKAHGYQICKMCEAFAQNGVAVLLMHPRRYQCLTQLHGQSVFDYYGIAPVFEVRSLGNWDVVRFGHLISSQLFTVIFFIHALLWGLYAALVASRQKAQLYYTRESYVAFWLTLLGLPTIYEVHAVPKRMQRSLLCRLIRQKALQRAIALTSFIKKQLVEMGLSAEKAIVQPDAVDLSLFADLPDKQACRKRLGLPLERPIIGYIGRFRTMEMEKGIPQLVEAMAHLPPIEGKEPLLLCVGGPMDAVPAYREIARRFQVPEHRLEFGDRVHNSQVPYWIKTFDLAVAPYPNIEHYAYFMSPLKLFEYMAAGVPIVASDLPAIREILRHQENAWLVPPGDPIRLADSIKILLGDRALAQQLAKQAREDVQSLTWQKRAQVIWESYFQSAFKEKD